MNLPIYQIINLQTNQLDELGRHLHAEINMHCPVAFNLKKLPPEQQRELIGLIENYFDTQEISYRFPYPVYVITDHADSMGNIPLIRGVQELPTFFNQKEARVTVKETQLVSRNQLYQQEINNTDTHKLSHAIEHYGHLHRQIHQLACESEFYQHILKKLRRVKGGHG